MRNASLRLALLFLGLMAYAVLEAPVARGAQPLINVLIFSGQNNHEWRKTTPQIKTILSRAGVFRVEVTETPEKTDAAKLANFHVVLSDWNTFGTPAVTNWPENTRIALLDFVRRGNGFVVVHAGGSSFYDWPEYQQMAGAFWDLGQTSHGTPHEFLVTPRGKHPITRDVAPFRTRDELWIKPGVDPAATVIATGEDQPVALVTSFGQGRSFTLLLGHSAEFMEIPGFSVLLSRGVEWAATGNVTLSPAKTGGN